MRRLFVKRGRPFSALEPPELKNPERELSHFRRRLIAATALIVLGFAGLVGRFVYGNLGHERAMRSIRLFSDEVMPHFRSR